VISDGRTAVAYKSVVGQYSDTPPFHPGESYPEYPFDIVSSEPNIAYDAVRQCFRTAGLDSKRYGSSSWNPLKGLIHPGERVLLKPNLVKETHPRDPSGWRYVLTHGSVIRAVADYVWKALEGRGSVVIADAPQTDSSFERITEILGLDSIRNFYNRCGFKLELVDLRREEWVTRDGVVIERRNLAGDPRGCVAVDLGKLSSFSDHSGSGRYYGADYDAEVVNYHHSDGRHEYLIAGSAMNCDVIFSLPKLKTHKKAGITVSLKNMVGINGDKNWLPHHTEGHPANGGDEHPSPGSRHKAERALVPHFRQLSASVPGVGPWLHRQARRFGRHVFGDTEEVIRSGNWWGNETIWRMCLDLNKIILYGNSNGTLRAYAAANRKRHFVLVDGLVAGEGRGPMNPDPVLAGIVVFGEHPATVDAACAYLMGFDPEKIPIVREAFRCQSYPLAEWHWRDVQLISNHAAWNGKLEDIASDATLHFEPHFGWKGHIERTNGESGVGRG
jgi:uncharacterized protein (DUF362 family)